jgi:hypothetical protein
MFVFITLSRSDMLTCNSKGEAKIIILALNYNTIVVVGLAVVTINPPLRAVLGLA